MTNSDDTPNSTLPTEGRIPFQARIRKSAFFDAVRRHGCDTFGVYNRTYISMGFHDPVTEYWDLLNGVVLWPAAGERQLQIRGPDAERFVQLLTPRDLRKQAVGQCKYILVSAPDGGIVNDPVCLRLAEDLFWLSAADSDIWLYARGINAMANMDVEISDPGVTVMQIQGPRSKDVLRALVGDDIESLRFYWCREYTIAGAQVVVSRTGWSSEWGYELYLRDASLGDVLFEHVLNVGREFHIRLGAVSQIRRIEGGLLSYGADMDISHNPYEVGLGWLVDLDTPNQFIGRTALERLAKQPPTRQLAGIAVEGAPLTGFIDPWLISHPPHAPSKLTSVAWSPRLEHNIGLAILPTDVSAPGTNVTLDTPEGARLGTVTALPFVSRKTV